MRYHANIDDDALAGPADALQILQRGSVGDVVRRRLPVDRLDGVEGRRELVEHGIGCLLVVQAWRQQEGIEPRSTRDPRPLCNGAEISQREKAGC